MFKLKDHPIAQPYTTQNQRTHTDEGIGSDNRRRVFESNVAIPTISQSSLDIDSRAKLLNISKRSVSIISSNDFMLFHDEHINRGNLSKVEIRSLEKTQVMLEKYGITREIWKLKKDNYLKAVRLITSALEKSVSRNEILTINTIQCHPELAPLLKQLAKDEEDKEPCSILLSLCLDNKIIELQGLAYFQRPTFDWRECYSRVVEHVYTFGEKKATTKQQPDSTLSREAINKLARSAGIPHVAYAPSSYYNDGPILFPLNKRDVMARERFSKVKKNELKEFEDKLRDSGCSAEFFTSSWCFFCEYTHELCAIETDSLTKEKAKKSLLPRTKSWLQWVKENQNELLAAKLFSLIIDNINLVILPHHKTNAAEPIFNWRDILEDIHALSEEEILECFEDFDPQPTPSPKQTLAEPEIDIDDNEFSEGYEEKRMKQLAAMQVKHDSSTKPLGKRKPSYDLIGTASTSKSKRAKID